MNRRAVSVLFALVAVLAFGTIGYVLIEGWTILEGLFMTVITVATVGYGIVHPLSKEGEIFTIALILCGIAVEFLALATIVDYLLGGHFSEVLEGRRMNTRIGDLKGHAIVCGLGRVGSVIGRALDDAKFQFVVVDRSEEAIEAAREYGWLYVHGDATEEHVMQAAGIDRASSLVTVLDNDAENLFVTVTARALNPELFIVARSAHESSENKIKRAGANRVITPNVIGGRRMAAMVMHPVVSDFLDIVVHGEELEFHLEEFIAGPECTLVGRSIIEARIREATGVYVLAVKSASGTFDPNPLGTYRFSEGDHIVGFGTQEQLDTFASKLKATVPHG